LFFLAYPLLTGDPALGIKLSEDDAESALSTWDWLGRYYLPRLGVGLKFVGFFFLRLYVANEIDLKHNKNEMTNLEAKMISYYMSRGLDDKQAAKAVIESLARTERNFVIRKNERIMGQSVDLEYNDLKGLLERVLDRINMSDDAKR
jgi:hypothetical protein